MTGPFGTTAGPWVVVENEIWDTRSADDPGIPLFKPDRGSDRRWGRNIERGEIEGNAKAIAQVPAMLALVDAVADWVNIEDVRDMARAIVRELEGE